MSPSFLDGGTLALLIVAFQSLFFKEMGQPRPLFVYFHSFQTQILQKNCRRQRDSN